MEAFVRSPLIVTRNVLSFYNPIVNRGQDPSVKYYDGNYYLTQSVSDAIIVVMRSPQLENLGSPEQNVTVFVGSGEICCEIWAPELVYIEETALWYIYFAADDGNDANHRSYVLQSSGNDPLGPYTLIGKMAAATDMRAIDSTVMKLGNQLYFIWSGNPEAGNSKQNLYAATMSSPTNITSDRYMISEPTEPWEFSSSGQGINEGPAVLQVNGSTWIAYSANGGDNYCLGLLTYIGGDPLRQTSWLKSEGYVFAMNASNSVYGPGHNSFTTSPDLTQVWNVYHAEQVSNGGWGNRSIRTQIVNFDLDGTPNFGTPAGFTNWIDPPRGE